MSTPDSSYPQALRDAIQRNVDQISDSAAFVQLYNPAMSDFVREPLPAIQLAIAILLDKPIIIGCLPGREPPEKLRAIADHVFYGDPEFIARKVTEVLRS